MTCTANVDGNTDIYLYAVATGRRAKACRFEGIERSRSLSAFSRDNARLLYYHNGLPRPAI
jgi:hypothetical protein